MKNRYDNLVSVIMPAYNAGKYIVESINSVLNQTYSEWELLIINDNSKDNTVKIIHSYLQQDSRIKIIDLKRNMGVAVARNRGIALARGRYIAFLDSDDIWLPEKLNRQIHFMKDRRIPMSFTQYRQFIHDPREKGKLIDVLEKVNYNCLLKGNIIGCLTVMIDRNFIPQINMPNNRHEDYITWLDLLKNDIFAYGLKEDLARYRKSKNSLSGNKLKSMKWTWNVYRESQKLSFLKSFYYFSCYALRTINKHYY